MTSIALSLPLAGLDLSTSVIASRYLAVLATHVVSLVSLLVLLTRYKFQVGFISTDGCMIGLLPPSKLSHAYLAS